MEAEKHCIIYCKKESWREHSSSISGQNPSHLKIRKETHLLKNRLLFPNQPQI